MDWGQVDRLVCAPVFAYLERASCTRTRQILAHSCISAAWRPFLIHSPPSQPISIRLTQIRTSIDLWIKISSAYNVSVGQTASFTYDHSRQAALMQLYASTWRVCVLSWPNTAEYRMMKLKKKTWRVRVHDALSICFAALLMLISFLYRP